jgi:hypothetical protein
MYDKRATKYEFATDVTENQKNQTRMNTDLFYRRDEEDIRESDYQAAGHQEFRISGEDR